MAILKKVKRCSHCGAILQTEDKEKTGFISSVILKKYPDGVLLCDKCFNEEKSIDNVIKLNEEYVSILKTIKKTNSLVVYVLDLFSFEGGFSSDATELLSGLDVIVVANKIDLLPKEVDEKEIISYVSHRLKVSNLNVKDIVITSSHKGININKIASLLEEKSNGRDVYFVGSQTSGKSTLMSEILKTFDNNTNKFIVTYTFPNTSLRGFQIPLNNKNYMYEVPGFPITNSLLGLLEKPIVNYIQPRKPVVDRKFVINNKTALAIGGLCFVELLNDKKTTLNCYVSDKITIKTKKGDHEKFFESILTKGDQNNTSYKFRTLSDFEIYDIEIKEEGERDIGILGLGWMQFKANNQLFRIYVPKGVHVYTTRARLKNVK